MVVKVKAAEDATNKWRKERDQIDYIKSPTNLPRNLSDVKKYI
jgi:hypothetical protein